MNSGDCTPSPRALIFLIQVAVGLCYLLAFTSAMAQSPAQQQTLEAFQRLHVQGDALIRLVPGSVPHRIEISGAGTEPVDAELVADALYIDTRGHSRQRALVVTLFVDRLHELVVDGNANIEAAGLHAANLVLEARGSGTVRMDALNVNDLTVVGRGQTQFLLSGTAEHQSVDLAGSGYYRAGDLHSKTTQISVNGSGHLTLWADEFLDLNVLGSANVEYSGAPWVHRKIFGEAAVSPLAGFGHTSL